MPSRKAFWYLALIVNLVLTVSSPAQNARPTESQVKAAYLYNFGKFVRWQVERIAKSDSLELCILGKDPFGPILDSTVEGQSIDGRKITVRRVANVSESMQCSILFISASEEGRLGGILSAAQRFGTLTVSDIPHFADRGGVIGFVLREDRIRFEVNRGAAEQSHLTLSSELLKVASKVMEKSPPQG
ncbi:MAG TPA: YfiR family protein [Candidatus Sulfotelmatobacter sp.]